MAHQINYLAALPQSVASHKRPLKGRTFLIVTLTPAVPAPASLATQSDGFMMDLGTAVSAT